MRGDGRIVQRQTVVAARGDVGPPFPRRDAQLARQVDRAVDGAAAVGAGNDDIGAVVLADDEAAIGFPLALQG